MPNTMDDFVDQLGVITPVYIVGLIAASQAVLGLMIASTPETKAVAYFVLIVFAIAMIYAVEVRNRKYIQRKEWVQLGAICFSSFLYLTLGYVRILNITSLMWMNIEWLFILYLVTAIWTFGAPYLIPKPEE